LAVFWESFGKEFMTPDPKEINRALAMKQTAGGKTLQPTMLARNMWGILEHAIREKQITEKEANTAYLEGLDMNIQFEMREFIRKNPPARTAWNKIVKEAQDTYMSLLTLKLSNYEMKSEQSSRRETNLGRQQEPQDIRRRQTDNSGGQRDRNSSFARHIQAPRPDNRQPRPTQPPQKKWCTYHNSGGHNTNECRAAAATAGAHPQRQREELRTTNRGPRQPAVSAVSVHNPSSKGKTCEHCGKLNHTAAECWKKNPHLKPAWAAEKDAGGQQQQQRRPYQARANNIILTARHSQDDPAIYTIQHGSVNFCNGCRQYGHTQDACGNRPASPDSMYLKELMDCLNNLEPPITCEEDYNPAHDSDSEQDLSFNGAHPWDPVDPLSFCLHCKRRGHTAGSCGYNTPHVSTSTREYFDRLTNATDEEIAMAVYRADHRCKRCQEYGHVSI